MAHVDLEGKMRQFVIFLKRILPILLISEYFFSENTHLEAKLYYVGKSDKILRLNL